jgi:hypothetical protein
LTRKQILAITTSLRYNILRLYDRKPTALFTQNHRKRGLTEMSENNSSSPYYIFINGGDGIYVLGKTGDYETNLTEAVSFAEKLSAIMYIEKYGLEKIATVRKVEKIQK